MKTYRYVSQNPGSVTFANVANINERLTFTNEVKAVTNQPVPFSVVRTSVVLALPLSIQDPTCTDGCGPKGKSAETVRLEFSAPEGKSVDIMSMLTDLTAYIKANPTLLSGFNPSTSSDVTLGTA